MDALAVVMERPEQLALRQLSLVPATDADVVVDVLWSGVSTGTERLLWTGRMPPFPGMGYPLVPGYESVGRISDAGPLSGRQVGEMVFVPGSRGFQGARGLFGGAASRLLAPGAKTIVIDERLGSSGVLLALAATAMHALNAPDAHAPELIVGHGVLGRLLARIAVARGHSPVVWENNPQRHGGAAGYRVITAEEDQRRNYGAIYDVSGDASLLPALIERLGHAGEIVLAGFYEDPIRFDFPLAFLREARLRVAAEWKENDLAEVRRLISEGSLSLDGLITHVEPAANAPQAYRTAFSDASCLKMILDWRACA